MMRNKWVLKFRHMLHDLVNNFAPNSIKIRIMSCENITKIMASEEKLSPAKKFWFNVHNFICSCCSNYQDQFNIIKINSKKLVSPDLTEEQKQRIENSKSDLLKQLSNK